MFEKQSQEARAPSLVLAPGAKAILQGQSWERREKAGGWPRGTPGMTDRGEEKEQGVQGAGHSSDPRPAARAARGRGGGGWGGAGGWTRRGSQTVCSVLDGSQDRSPRGEAPTRFPGPGSRWAEGVKPPRGEGGSWKGGGRGGSAPPADKVPFGGHLSRASSAGAE